MTLADLIKEHAYDELIFGGFVCLPCSLNEGDDPDTVAWPCSPLRAAGMTDAHAVAHIENDRLRRKVERLGKKITVLEKRAEGQRATLTGVYQVTTHTIAAGRQIAAHTDRGDSPSLIFYSGAALALDKVRAVLDGGEQS